MPWLVLSQDRSTPWTLRPSRCGQLVDLQEDVLDAARTQVSLPGQHVPWVPHVTAGYSMDPGQVSYTGQVLSDRLGFAWSGKIHYYPC